MKLFYSSLLLTALYAGQTLAMPLGSGFTYQGKLTDGGAPANGKYDMIFNLYDSPTNGNFLGNFSIFGAVPVSDGLFTVELNSYGEFGTNAFNGEARWLQIGVRTNNNNAMNSWIDLSPREPLNCTPQAMFALNAMNAANAASANVASTVPDGSITTSKLTPGMLNWSNITGVTAGPGLILGSNNQLKANFAGSGTANTVARGDHGHFGESWIGSNSFGGLTITNTSENGAGLWGIGTSETGTSAGVIGGSSSPAGMGVFGIASSTNGVAYGVVGQTHSPQGIGMYGWATATSNASTIGVAGQTDASSGYGVIGAATATDGTTCGVLGQSGSASGYGVLGKATSSSGLSFGVRGETDSTGGRAVSGVATATLGTTVGVSGEAKSSSGQGVNGLASATTGYTIGVSGQADSTSGVGIRGLATAGSGTTAGVRGEAYSSQGFGVEARNNNGVAIKASGTGIIQSDADSYIMIPGSAGNGFLQTVAYGNILVLEDDTYGHDLGSIPLALPQTLYGQSTVIKSLEIFYKCWDNTKGFITNTVVTANTTVTLMQDPTQHKSTSFSSYTLTFNPPLVSLPNGFLSVRIDAKMSDSFGGIDIHGIKARLGHE